MDAASCPRDGFGFARGLPRSQSWTASTRPVLIMVTRADCDAFCTSTLAKSSPASFAK
jgi:hypothetical protein